MYNRVPARLVLLLAGGSLGLSSSRLTAASSAPLLCGLQCWQRTPPALGRPPVLALEATARAGGGCCAFRRWQGPPPERPPRAGGVRCCATAPSLTEEAPEEASLAARAAARAAENAEILAIAVPALLNTLMDPFLGVVDTLFVGRTCSSVALGAVAASSEIFTLCIAASLALRESASSTLVRLFAQGRRPAAVAFARRTLQLAVLVGAFLTLLLAGPAAPWCVGLMGAPVGSPLHPDALAYARMRALALPAALALSASEGIFRGMGDTSAPLRAGLVASLANLLLDPGLMIWPARLGVTGAAAATGASQVVACCLLLRSLHRQLFSRPRSAAASDPASAVPAAAAAAAASALAPAAGSPGGEEAAEEAAEEEVAARRRLAGTSAATLTRTSAVLGCWVYIASTVARRLGPSAIAAHGVALKAPS